MKKNLTLLFILATLSVLMLWCSKRVESIDTYIECGLYTGDSEVIAWLCESLHETVDLCLQEPVESEGWHRCVRDYDLIIENLETFNY